MADQLQQIYGATTIVRASDGEEFAALLSSRRSIRRIVNGPFPVEVRTRIEEATRLTPAAFNLPTFHAVLVHEQRDEFWREVEAGFRAGLTGDRLEHYLSRLAGFRDGVAAIAIYEDRAAIPALKDAWGISQEQAAAFSQQSLGMVQLSIWLALTAEGLVTSIQHWDWLIEKRLERFFGLPEDRYALTVVLPIGYPDEAPREQEAISLERVLSRNRFGSR